MLVTDVRIHQIKINICLLRQLEDASASLIMTQGSACLVSSLHRGHHMNFDRLASLWHDHSPFTSLQMWGKRPPGHSAYLVPIDIKQVACPAGDLKARSQVHSQFACNMSGQSLGCDPRHACWHGPLLVDGQVHLKHICAAEPPANQRAWGGGHSTQVQAVGSAGTGVHGVWTHHDLRQSAW